MHRAGLATVQGACRCYINGETQFQGVHAYAPSCQLISAKIEQLIAKALIALYGSILFWVGLWTSLDLDFFKRSLQRDLCYTFVGLGLMVVADSFYSNAGVDGR